MSKRACTFRLSTTARDLLSEMSEETGMNSTFLVEEAIGLLYSSPEERKKATRKENRGLRVRFLRAIHCIYNKKVLPGARKRGVDVHEEKEEVFEPVFDL